jgi:hypothetical protein
VKGATMKAKNDLVTVKTFVTEIDAQVAKAFLESKGIKSIVEKDDMGGQQPSFQLTGGVSLVVRKRDRKKAIQLLDAVER